MSKNVAITVGTSPVAVTAGSSTWSVSLRQAPNSAAVAFNVYDANQNLLTQVNPIRQNGTYQWVAPQTGSPFIPGQVVGYVAIAAGSTTFLVDDSNQVPYPQPVQQEAFVAAGAITQKSGRAFLTGPAAVAYTLAAPLPGSDDGKQLEIVDTTGKAHTVTTPAAAINGTLHVATYSGTIGVTLILDAFGGVWYARSATGNGITLS